MSMTDTMRIIDAPAEIPPEWAAESAAKDSDPKRCAEPGCTNAPAVTPTGRTGKYCDEHKKQSARTGQSAPRAKRNGWARAAEVETALTQFVQYAGMGLQVINRVDGQIIAQGGPAVVTALVEIAKTDTKLRRYLEMAATPGKYGPLVLAVLGVVIPVMANHDLLPRFFVDLTKDTGGGEHI